MDVEIEVEAAVRPMAYRGERVMFRGVDCAELADRYATYRRALRQERGEPDPDIILPAGRMAGGDTTA